MIRMVVCQVHVISAMLGFDFGNTQPCLFPGTKSEMISKIAFGAHVLCISNVPVHFTRILQMCSLWNWGTTWEQKIPSFASLTHTVHTCRGDQLQCGTSECCCKRTCSYSSCKTKCFSPPQQPFISVQCSIHCTACHGWIFPNNIPLPAATSWCTMCAALQFVKWIWWES